MTGSGNPNYNPNSTCANNSQCPDSTYECVNGQCPYMNRCNPNAKRCQRVCDSIGGCPTGFTCNPVNRFCIQ